MATNDVWRLTVRGRTNETQHIHTLHFLEVLPQLDGGESLLTAWKGTPMVSYRELFNINQPIIQEVTAQKVCGSQPLPSPNVFIPDTAGTFGIRTTAGNEAAPAYVATCVVEKGTLQGKRYSGRFFLGGMYEMDLQQNQISDAYYGLANNYCVQLASVFLPPNGANWRLFAFSKLLAEGNPNRQIKNPNGPGYITSGVPAVGNCQSAGSPVKALIVNRNVTTMRSRKLGHGL